MEKTKKNSVLKEWIRIVLLIVLAVILFLCRDKLQIQKNYPFLTVFRACFSESSDLMVIDKGKAAVEILESTDAGNVLRRTMKGESLEGFFNANSVAGDPENGEMIVHERVVEMQSGGEWRVAADSSALMRDGVIGTGGNIYDLQISNGAAWFLWWQEEALNLYRILPGGEAELLRSVPCEDSISGASIDLSTGLIAAATHRGVVTLLPEGTSDWIDLPKDAEHLMCFDVAARAGELYFSDMYAGRVCRVTGLDSGDYGMETVFEGEGPLYAITLSDDAQTVLVSDGMAFYRISGEDSEYISEASVSWFELSVMLWICLAAAAALLIYELRGLPRWLVKQLRKESGLRIFLVLVSTLIVSGFVIFSLMKELFSREDEVQLSNTEMFADLMISRIDTDALSRIQWEGDYGSEDYDDLCFKIDEWADDLDRAVKKKGRKARWAWLCMQADGWLIPSDGL